MGRGVLLQSEDALASGGEMIGRGAPDSAAVTRVGELLLLMRQGFLVAGADRGQAVYEGAEGAIALGNVGQLLAEGKVRVRVEWLSSGSEEKHPDTDVGG